MDLLGGMHAGPLRQPAVAGVPEGVGGNWSAPRPDRGADRGMTTAAAQLLDGLRTLLAVAGAGDTSTERRTDWSGGEPESGTSLGPAYGRGSTPPEDVERVTALVALAQRGDAEAFGLLYERYVDIVFRYVYVRVGSRHLAEDLTSETFVRALRRIDSFTWQGRDIAAWFVTIARNLIMDNAKSARYRMEIATADMLDADRRDDAAEPEAAVMQRQRDARLLEAVRSLKPEQAECVMLRFLHGLSLAETAAVLGRSEGAVKQLQLRAIRSLSRQLEGEVL